VKLVQGRAAADSAFGKELIASLTEACEHAEGRPGRVRFFLTQVRPLTPEEIRDLRERGARD
jgi:hypothetical protein